ncbi:MAG: yhiR [Pantoea agglomerans]|nr:yhiR [Pantoea agglomerans]
MLSYRHSFHAGNHADVLKHTVLSLIITALKEKEKPFFYLDTHAGAGRYQLSGEHAPSVPVNIWKASHVSGSSPMRRNCCNPILMRFVH